MRRSNLRNWLPRASSRGGFALFEVMLGVIIFVVGILALGRAVENCMNASILSQQEDRVRQVLADRMAVVQATPGAPEDDDIEVETGYGEVKILQRAVPAELTNEEEVELNGMYRVGLTAKWKRGGVAQERTIEFYVYRPS